MSLKNICNICGSNYEYRKSRWICPGCGAYKEEELSPEETTLLYSAAQKLRLSNFSEAEEAYTDIIEKYPQNANAYWGRLLSKYGIKYEEDFDGRKIPTCYATSIESVTEDNDYKKAMKFADAENQTHFANQARYIERVRKEWIEKASKEAPYDIFICYKDSDRANGIIRTQDSIDAMEIYTHLKDQGYRVFYSRESLRDKSGEKYEPYINQAVATAKVMIVYSLSSEYVMSTWVKNEWTRYQKMMNDGIKRQDSLLVVCKGFSPSELPTSLSALQCMDASKMTFFGDLDKAIRDVLGGENANRQKSNSYGESKKNNALTCPSCGGNFSVSDLIDDDDFVTCNECGKVYFTSDIFPNISVYKAKKAEERRKIEEEEKKKEQDRLRQEQERRAQEWHNATYSYTKPQSTRVTYSSRQPTKYCNKWVAFCLCFFYLGFFGVHRFYEGDKKWGKIYLCTLGLCGYGWLFDIFRILLKPTRYPKKMQ